MHRQEASWEVDEAYVLLIFEVRGKGLFGDDVAGVFQSILKPQAFCFCLVDYANKFRNSGLPVRFNIEILPGDLGKRTEIMLRDLI